VLGLLAASSGLPISRLAMWEPPFDPDAPTDQVAQYERMISERRRGDAVEYFMAQVVHLPPEFVTGARQSPWWEAAERIAHTLAYDARVMDEARPPEERAASVKIPTLVIAGGADIPWMRDVATALADALPDGSTRFLDGQGHDVDPTVLAPVLREFFAA
jgi:pimeloyl-ACP methyl ester carboxylesterase